MPDNRLMYFAIVLVVAAASLWLGAELTRAGILLIVLGVVLEFWKQQDATAR